MTAALFTPEQRLVVEALASGDAPVALRRRAILLLLYDDGHATREVAQSVGISPSSARRWRRMLVRKGMAIFRTVETPDGPPSIEAGAAEQPPETTSPELQDEGSEPAPPPPAGRVGEPDYEQFFRETTMQASPGLQADDSLAEAGRKAWRYQFGWMLKNEAGTRLGEDIEALHDMRVATRRMRAAFEIFGEAFDPKTLKPLWRGLRLTGRALGKVRDLDVLLEKAEKYMASLPPAEAGKLTPLLEAWEEERQAARVEMTAHLDSDAYEKFKKRFYRFVTTPGAGALEARSDDPFAQPHPSLVREVVPGLVYDRLAAVRAFDAILERASLEQFHALRIEFKKLRYAVEFFREVLGPEAKAVINHLKGIQDHLGDLNDAQVAGGLLRGYLVRWDERQAALPVVERMSPEPVLAYLGYQYQERQRLMLSFSQTWAKFNRPEFRQNLASAVAAL